MQQISRSMWTRGTYLENSAALKKIFIGSVDTQVFKMPTKAIFLKQDDCEVYLRSQL
jgi:hypothetical protein